MKPTWLACTGNSIQALSTGFEQCWFLWVITKSFLLQWNFTGTNLVAEQKQRASVYVGAPRSDLRQAIFGTGIRGCLLGIIFIHSLSSWDHGKEPWVMERSMPARVRMGLPPFLPWVLPLITSDVLLPQRVVFYWGILTSYFPLRKNNFFALWFLGSSWHVLSLFSTLQELLAGFQGLIVLHWEECFEGHWYLPGVTPDTGGDGMCD